MSAQLSFPRYTLALAFGLEVAAVVSYGFWAWRTTSGPLRLPVTVGLPVAVACVWAVFATAGAQVSGTTVVATPGPVRLLLELAILGGAVAALFQVGARQPAWIFAVVLAVHLLLTRDRLAWLFNH